MVCGSAVLIVSDQDEEWVPLALRNHTVVLGQALFSQGDVDAAIFFEVVDLEDFFDVSCQVHLLDPFD